MKIRLELIVRLTLAIVFGFVLDQVWLLVYMPLQIWYDTRWGIFKKRTAKKQTFMVDEL